MKCLNQEQLMELLYKEGKKSDLQEYKNHIINCKDCLKKFIELVEAREYLKDLEKEQSEPIVIVLENRKRMPAFSKIAAIAATLLLAFSLIFTVYQTKRIEAAEKRIAFASRKLEREIEEVSYKTEKTARDNYMLIMGLKNYIDSAIFNNQNTRRASYEKF